ncbi:MAG: glycosyltransferase, partial [Tistlia sp.]
MTITTLYPNAAEPNKGIFVENRLRHLLASGRARSRVIAPVPWFPSAHPRFGTYAAYARAPRQEQRHGIEVAHPRYLVVPKVGMTLAPFLLFLAMWREVRRLRRAGFEFDAIDAHYYYPDGVAAALLARLLGKPLTITARGTDINLIPRYALPRRLIRWAIGQAAASITVCQALKDVLVELGAEPDSVTVIRNGVDLEAFRPLDREAIRRRMKLEGPVVASVGYLIERKAHDLLIAALPELPGTTLLIAGSGPEEARLRRQAETLGVAGRVRFLGALPHDALLEVYNAADVTALASSREGFPNVLLESIACGTPVVASRVWGTPELITSPSIGRL